MFLSGWWHFQLGEGAEDRSDASNGEAKLGHVQPIWAWSLHGNNNTNTLSLAHLCVLCWFTQTSMNEWMFLYLWDMMGQVLNQSNITHHNFSSCWWTLHGYLKHVLPAWKRLHSEMRIVFCSNSMTVTLFPICLCVCASVQIVSFHIYFRPQRLLEEGYYSAYKCHNQISIYITSWNFSHQNMSYRFTSWNFPTFFL